MSSKEHIRQAVRNLQEAIFLTSGIVASEARNPGFGGPDELDDKMADGKKLVEALRRIRQELENLELTEYL